MTNIDTYRAGTVGGPFLQNYVYDFEIRVASSSRGHGTKEIRYLVGPQEYRVYDGGPAPVLTTRDADEAADRYNAIDF